jgi:hypothetical protein
MILLDENIREDQAGQLLQWRIHCRFLVGHAARSGIQDSDIIPLLHHLKQPTFLTHDRDFFRRELAHPAYCLVWLDVFDGEAANFIRAFLKHPRFDTACKRLGTVVHVHPANLSFWILKRGTLQREGWAADRGA